ncbi:hypothetical protein MMC13_005239 [Lambiella insularis]|nr:hypothetical protein [Lambiella insularis]
MDDYSQALAGPHMCRPPCPASSRHIPFKLDEGYSEETRSQYDGDSSMGVEPASGNCLGMSVPSLVGLPDATMALSEAERSEYVYNVLRTLRTSSIAAVVERLRPLLHIDPVGYLPPEITSQIFSYLAPPILLQSSKVSKSWRERTLDSRLWKQKYIAEGWSLDASEVAAFERSYSSSSGLRKTLSRKANHQTDPRKQKKRLREEGFLARKFHGSRLPGSSKEEDAEVRSWRNQGCLVEVDAAEPSGKYSAEDQEMLDAPLSSAKREDACQLGRIETLKSVSPDAIPSSTSSPRSLKAEDEEQSLDPDAMDVNWKKSRLAYGSLLGSPRLNFQHLYKQKRKLEENWTIGKYTSFQLPHKDHPEEAHTECVYTIQYSGKFLVSGSRDRTLRIWNLDNQRLIGKPLAGHNGSVLCLQFDSRETEDIIVSGSSDTDVIIWQFSTGKIIKKLARAHKESVLNLKFDERFLVTCSKDKTIKIWNRHELRPGDADYPLKGLPDGGKCPSYIIDLTNLPTPMDIDACLTQKQKQPLPKYTALMIIDSHGAAVNAVHIYKDQLVSASGDRSLKIWNIHSGVRNAICIGHTKGIACVQYDGKRVVSGSSDNTIRIFDAATQAEVACLLGHSKLVRTVQASFGDEPGTEHELELEARDIDRAYFEARRTGAIPTSSARSHRDRDRNAGSRRPENIMAVGAKLPPGGGGSAWGRIVSGSYDESIIIWKKTSDGSWVPGYRLHQSQALRAAGGPLIARSELVQQAQVQNFAHIHQTHGPLVIPQAPIMNAAPQPTAHQMQQIQAHMSAHQLVQHAMQSGAAALQAGLQNVAALHTQLGNNAPIHPTLQLPHMQAYMQHHQQIQQQQMQMLQQQQSLQQSALLQQQTSSQNQSHATQQDHTQQGLPQQQIQPQQQDQVQQQLPPSQQVLPQQQQMQAPPATNPPQPVIPPSATQQQLAHYQAAHAALPLAHGPVHQGVPGIVSHPNARVFKLQFDARRLVCCSQDPKIVGWDFANGDEEIMECSRFFGAPG